MSRYTFISSDCHAAPKMPDYRPYVAAAHRESFDDWLAESQRQAAEARRNRIGGNLFDEDYIEEAEKNDAFAASHMDGLWSHETRVNDLEADGVVAEVIFPNGIPFTPLRGGEVGREARLEGTRAYNRWLSDFCQQAPGRRGGIAVLDLHDIDAAVTEIRSAREAGLFAGVLLPPAGEPVARAPHYNHPRYEPIWTVCEELGMPVNLHGGASPDYGEFPGSLGAFLTEVTFWAHRPFWFMLWGGVLERHPGLRLMVSEQTVDWIPSTLEFMDYLYKGPLFAQVRRELSLKPSDYFARQCWAGASFMTRLECEMREGIGVDRIMFGTDYPHVEGTWPNTAARLRHTFGGLPEAEVAAMLGGNAAEAYGFDLEKLSPVADQVGPEVSTLLAGPTPEDLAQDGTAYLLR